MKPLPALLLPLCLGLPLAPAAGPPGAPPQSGPALVFNLLPRSMQKRPFVDFNIVTEMTHAGRLAPQPARGVPIRYVGQPAGFLQLGHGAGAREKPPEVTKMEQVLERSLAAGGYLPAAPGEPASVVVIYSWGSHSNPLTDDDPEAATVTNKRLIDEMIERARLVGGGRFAQEFVDALAEAGAARAATTRPRVDPTGAVPTQPDALGEAAGLMTEIFNPVERFRNRSDKTRHLMADVGGSVYFVVASAYDHASVARGDKVLLWRTFMSVNSSGITLTETLPALVAAAAPYFGRDMPEVEIVSQRINRDGQVEIGIPEVLGFSEGPVPPPAAAREPGR